MSTSLFDHGFARESASNAVVALTSKEREDIKSCVLSWNERFQKLEAVITSKSSGKTARFGWDFDAKSNREGQRILPSRLNRISGYNDRYVLTDRPVTKKEA